MNILFNHEENTLIRKLFAAGAVLAVAVIAVMLMTVGSSPKPAEAHVQSITGPAFISPALIGYAEIRIVAQDGHGDVRITASAGGFFYCEYQDTSTCSTYDEVGVIAPYAFTVDDGSGDVDFITAGWGITDGFPGGAVLFTACQFDQNCPAQAKTFTMQIGGSVASIALKAQRNYTTEGSVCAGTPVYIIAATEYTFNNLTTFNNDRAIICADVRDSVGHPLTGEQIAWNTTDGCLESGGVTNTGSNGLTHNRLVSCGLGASGDVATVTANAGVVSNSVQVAFGGDPVSCSLVMTPDPLDVGNTAHVVATFIDAKGNLVPDGIVAHLAEVDSGDGADNVQFVSVPEDTVKGKVEGDLIGAIAGLTTIAASVEQIAGADPTCAEAIELSGNVHQTPGVCVGDPDFILYGSKPPAGGGFGTFAFCGGTYEQLLTASGCPKATSAFFYNKPSGSFAVWIPGSEVAAVNAEIFTIFPQEHTPIPKGTIFTAKCK